MSLMFNLQAQAHSQRFIKCRECERSFDLAQPVDAEEWYYGHDCEA
jgi:hypothetical protein